MQHPDALLLDALRAAPRRYRMPALPADAAAARAGDPSTALAFAIETARADAGAGVADAAREVFIEALAALVRKALAPGNGDPAFQALVLRARSGEVAEYLRLEPREAADRRTVRTAVDALAHPGKLRKLADGPKRDALAQLHALAGQEAWTELLRAAQPWDAFQRQLQPALERLQRGTALRSLPAVRQYLALCAQRGPLAGSDAASEHGRTSARVGSDAEQATLQAFRTIAALLQDHSGLPYRAVGSLLTPRGFPGAADKAKDEWDAAILRSEDGSGTADIALLAEVKASAAAALPDFSRLLRGIERLALAEVDAEYAFACAEGALRIRGRSLRRLQPQGNALPAHVIYCCAAEEAQPAALGAATRAVLLAEPSSIAFAQRLLAGEAAPPEALLAAVWEALATAPRLRSALHQYQTAVAARAAMLHPDDLLAAVRERLARVQNCAGSSP